jgi:hypothetical protein
MSFVEKIDTTVKFESAMVGVHPVDVMFGRLGLWVSGSGQHVELSLARRANAVMADPPSQQKSVDGAIAPPSAAIMLTASSRGKTASRVAPVRSRATMTGICSADRPRCWLCLPAGAAVWEGLCACP